MARYRNELDDERDYYRREERQRRDSLGAFDRSTARDRYEQDSRQDYNRGGRFGERAQYEYDEPRYSEQRGHFRDEGRRSSLYDVRGDLQPNAGGTATIEVLSGLPERSRLRCRDIMTRDLAVATRDTSISEVALMMKQEDTGVIPVVEYDLTPATAGRKAPNVKTTAATIRAANYSA